MNSIDHDVMTPSEQPSLKPSALNDILPLAATLPPLSFAAGMAALLAACGGGDTAGDTAGDAVARLGSEAARAPYKAILGGDAQKSMRQAKAQAQARLPTPDELMNWAEKKFPAFFPGPEPTRNTDNYVFRYYATNGNYLAILGQDVYVLGPITENRVVNVGTLTVFAEAVAAELANAVVNTDAEAVRFLLQAQFSASEAEIAEVRQKGYANWLDEQQARPVTQLAWDWMVSTGYTAIDTHEFFFATYPGDSMAWYQLMGAPDSVRQRTALALSNFFVVSLDGVNDSMNWSSPGMAHYWDILQRNAFGNYRTLLEEITLSPAMGAYLNTRGNRKEDPASGRLPDENYAREVMQLFSIGLNQLNLDGSVKLDAAGASLESYTQIDVSNLARVFTGYDANKSFPRGVNPNPPNQTINNVEAARAPMVLDARQHSPLEKKFLGSTIPANTAGAESLRIALDTLYKHPNVGPFLGRQMIQRLVTSNPSAAYVSRVASAFNANRAGVRGDLGHMFRTILLDDEARNPAGLTSLTFGKLREPVLRIAQWARTFKLKPIAGFWKIFSGLRPGDATRSLSQSPLQAPSVFNFFRPGYVPPSTLLAASKATAPEFQIVNESTVNSYITHLQSIVGRGYYDNTPSVPYTVDKSIAPNWVPAVVPDYTTELAMAHDTSALVARLNLLLCAGQLSPATLTFITNALAIDRLRVDSNADFKQIHVARAIMFVMCSAEYLVQK